MSGIMYFIIFMALFNVWMTIIITTFSFIIPHDENTNHKNRQNYLDNDLKPNKKLIYQESWVLKLECLQCHERFERFERWNKRFANNHSINAESIKEKAEIKENEIKERKGNEKENFNDLFVKKVVTRTKKERNKDDEKEKMEEWMRERRGDNEWLREWMDGIVG
ncbi:hypothetical protein C1645_762460 [Glomus cerebriforme]|uniref:Uncharacterized protein n=1 Tax=Glomus cerebriforme TaxID=658196 RepID=A0A397T6D4_9GLOM|nr:hypothetical protein C1645_762460 [Glomus cerebriforme]